MGTKNEFTNKEFETFVHENNLEVFTKSQVDKFLEDFVSKKDSSDTFEKSCGAADYASLTPVIVFNDDLTKSLVYYRPIQVESIQGDQEFGSILKSQNLQYADTPLNRFKGIVGLPVNSDVIEKARKAEPIGTEKTYGGKVYVKTATGWRPKSKKSSSEEKKTDLKREVTAGQYGGDRKEELAGEISKIRLRLMKKYDSAGSYWEEAADKANDPEIKRYQSLTKRLYEEKKKGE